MKYLLPFVTFCIVYGVVAILLVKVFFYQAVVEKPELMWLCTLGYFAGSIADGFSKLVKKGLK